jgi:tripartite-type tricarboxylate transporter receptor subunit TctC
MPLNKMIQRGLIATIAIGCMSTSVIADDYPSRPIRLIVPFAAGGSTDVTGRLLASNIDPKLLPQPIIVENKPGASGAIGGEIVAKSNPDGYTLCLCGSGPTVLLDQIDKNFPYNPQKEMQPIALLVRLEYALAVRADLGVETVQDLIKLAKDKPGKLNYGSPGLGNPVHLGMELFSNMAGVKLAHVPYKGESEVLNDMLKGVVDVSIFQPGTIKPLADAGKIKVIGIASGARSTVMPNVKLVSEQGLPGYEASTFTGITVAANTPKAIAAKLSDALIAAVRKPEVTDKLIAMGFEPKPLPPAEFGDFLRAEREKWSRVIESSGVKDRN